MSEYAILALFTYYALIKIAFNKRIIFQITFLISFYMLVVMNFINCLLVAEVVNSLMF
ncbi:hypothetical protein SD457_25265 [Coprobacillaceae bacterium CR2/5/TPMF4]|nr:hypothetical protein SD457_25265 [Coprobacillaceae bacterium CR2/5/TPMF4]